MNILNNIGSPAKIYAIVAILVILIKVMMNLTTISPMGLITKYGFGLIMVLIFTIIIEFLSRLHNIVGWVVAILFIISNVFVLI